MSRKVPLGGRPIAFAGASEVALPHDHLVDLSSLHRAHGMLSRASSGGHQSHPSSAITDRDEPMGRSAGRRVVQRGLASLREYESGRVHGTERGLPPLVERRPTCAVEDRAGSPWPTMHEPIRSGGRRSWLELSPEKKVEHADSIQSTRPNDTSGRVS